MAQMQRKVERFSERYFDKLQMTFDDVIENPKIGRPRSSSSSSKSTLQRHAKEVKSNHTPRGIKYASLQLLEEENPGTRRMLSREQSVVTFSILI